ncbi:hypothetical protein SteCoe_25663 [Stentor coeruleus]|uniref:Translin-associated factor X-interacting protein 1 N-terminal domain-containing protein n=1 Tax=Stentor coeruleus TaxID=5963 RepID=A0A1R2BEP6_9CILI|nr:hypothetical protein SteCoe_25663 [Stentor coeruleus]
MNDRQKLMLKLKSITAPNSSIEDIKRTPTKSLASGKSRDQSPYSNLKALPKQRNAFLMRKPSRAKRENLTNTRMPDPSISSSIKSPNDNINAHNLDTPEPQNYQTKSVSPNFHSLKHQTSNYKEKTPIFDLDYINNKLNILEKKPQSSSISEYLELFEIIISKDHTFGSLLKRIKNAIYDWKLFCDQSHEYIRSLEMKISEKQSFINQMIINKVYYNSRNCDSPIDKSCDIRNGDTEKPLYIIIPEYEINFLKEQNSQLNTKIESMMKQMSTIVEKEKKYAELISALRDRGYPIEEVFLKDVCWKSEKINSSSVPNSGYVSYNELKKNNNTKIDKSFADYLSSDDSVNDSF